MIVKGKARKDGAALALYMQNSEPGSRLIYTTDPYGDSVAAMTEWDEIGRLTQGEKPLYHCILSPDAKYKVTDAQYIRMAEITMEELGATGHDFEIRWHPGIKENGAAQPHAHLAICRTNRETLKMFDLSFNYAAHERASVRIALEFGWELVPGKHAKRDRQKQPEFPRAKSSQADHQQAERTEMSMEERKAQIAGIRQSCDGAHAFKNALEEAGYVMAKGDKRGIVLVDERGEIYSLSKYLTGDIKGKAYKEFIAPIDQSQLPSVDEATVLQKQHAVAKQEARAAKEQHETVAKSDGQPAPEKQLEAASETANAKQEPSPEPKEKGVEASKFLQQQEPAKTAAEAAPAAVDQELEALKKSLAARQAKEIEKWADLHAYEQKQFEFELDKLVAGKAADFDAMQQQERDALKRRHAEKRKGIKGIIEAIENRWNPTLAAEKTKERRRETALLKRRQEKEREDYLALLEQNRQLEIENLKERQALRLQQEQRKYAEEQERNIRDYEEAKRVRERMKAEQLQKELERNESLREGPPPPELGK